MGYFYADSCEQYIFFRMPKELFSPRFSALPCEAKILYGLLLDRMSLSRKKNWVDEQGRVYVIFSRKDAMESLGCGKEKAIKLFHDLEAFRLIEQERQGATRCNLIYVLEFHAPDPSPEPPPKPEKPRRFPAGKKAAAQKSPVASAAVPRSKVRSEKPTSLFLSPNEQESEVGKSDLTDEVRKTDLMKSENPTSIYKEYSKTEKNDTEIHPSYPSLQQIRPMDGAETRRRYLEQLHAGVDYPCLCAMVGDSPDGCQQVDELLEIALDALCTASPTLRIGGEAMPVQVVRSRLLKLTAEHVRYVLESLAAAKPAPIRNIRAYLLTALYRAPSTMALHDQAVFSATFFQQRQNDKAPTWGAPWRAV